MLRLLLRGPRLGQKMLNFFNEVEKSIVKKLDSKIGLCHLTQVAHGAKKQSLLNLLFVGNFFS